MGSVVVTLATAVGLFAATNIDDLVVVSVLTSSARTEGRPQLWQVWAGQYIGVAALVVVALATAAGLSLVPTHWVWLLGLIPFALGVRRLWAVISARRNGEPVSVAPASGVTGVTGLTISNGGDNIAAYTPLFHGLDTSGILIAVTAFAVCVAGWCLLGWWLVSHHTVDRVLRNWGHWIVPPVYIGIGLYILVKGGVGT